MAFDIIQYEQLRITLAEWMLKNNRTCACYNYVDNALSFKSSFTVPDTKFTFSGTADDNGVPVALFKTNIILKDWQTTSSEQKRFEYYRIDEIIPDPDGGAPLLKARGYIITER